MGFFDDYPYTNWHNVNLDWVLERVKEWGEMVEANDQAFKDLEEANASFKEYVTNYLQDLDVQAQIDDKLDRMFKSGELTEYLQPYVSNTVSDWLDEHITEPVGVVIDTSLTVAGACADAKATGDAINELRMKDPFSSEFKHALLACFENVAWINDHGKNYYNALENSLYHWDYTWEASSGVLPDGLTGFDYSFTREVGSLYVKYPNLNFNYIGNCRLFVEMKSYNIDNQGEVHYKGSNNPQIVIINSIIDETFRQGIKVIFCSSLGISNDHEMLGVGINGANRLILNSNGSEYHTYEITAVDNVYSLLIDGRAMSIVQNENTTPYMEFTGIASAIPEEPTVGYWSAFIKSIKFKRL